MTTAVLSDDELREIIAACDRIEEGSLMSLRPGELEAMCEELLRRRRSVEKSESCRHPVLVDDRDQPGVDIYHCARCDAEIRINERVTRRPAVETAARHSDQCGSNYMVIETGKPYPCNCGAERPAVETLASHTPSHTLTPFCQDRQEGSSEETSEEPLPGLLGALAPAFKQRGL